MFTNSSLALTRQGSLGASSFIRLLQASSVSFTDILVELERHVDTDLAPMLLTLSRLMLGEADDFCAYWSL